MAYYGRNIQDRLRRDLAKKMVLLAGPRQCGKTSTAKHLLKKETGKTNRYLNWDAISHREDILKENFPAGSGLIVLDEIHKYSRWRQVVKGLYDTRHKQISILVTGSGKLEHYSHGGDSLQGRYYLHRMFPMSLDEFPGNKDQLIHDFFTLGAFPEPLLSGSETEAKRWSKDYRHRLIAEEVSSLENVRDIGLLELLSLRLPAVVGSPLSINSLREDIQVSHKAASSWLDILEALFFHFRVYPFGSPLLRAVKKEAKLYLFDWLPIENKGARFENLVAYHLLKQISSYIDNEARDVELRYFRDTDSREVDFIITEKNKPIVAIETKFQNADTPKSLLYFKSKFPDVECYLVHFEKNKIYTDKHGVTHTDAASFLRQPVF